MLIDPFAWATGLLPGPAAGGVPAAASRSWPGRFAETGRSGVTARLPRMDGSTSEPLPAQVARLLLDYLLAGNVRPGTRLPSERRLAEELGVGRSVVREALKSLGLLGLVEVRQGDGTYLRRIESDLLPRVIEWGLLLGREGSDGLPTSSRPASTWRP